MNKKYMDRAWLKIKQKLLKASQLFWLKVFLKASELFWLIFFIKIENPFSNFIIEHTNYAISLKKKKYTKSIWENFFLK